MALFACGAPCDAADLAPSPTSTEQGETKSRLNSILFFGGMMSTTDIWSTMIFNVSRTSPGPNYDNYIAGAAYDRDLWDLGYGLNFGVEVGIADRFGKFKTCCHPSIMSNSILQSPELWAGVQICHGGILLFDRVRVGGGLTFGLSFASTSIGNELKIQIEGSGSGRVLYYLGPELTFSSPTLPNFELVLKLQHRSGGKTVPFLPTLANRAEGANANTAGIRYRF